MLRKLLARVRDLAWSERRDRETQDELAQHLDEGSCAARACALGVEGFSRPLRREGQERDERQPQRDGNGVGAHPATSTSAERRCTRHPTAVARRERSGG